MEVYNHSNALVIRSSQPVFFLYILFDHQISIINGLFVVVDPLKYSPHASSHMKVERKKKNPEIVLHLRRDKLRLRSVIFVSLIDVENFFPFPIVLGLTFSIEKTAILSPSRIEYLG